MLLAHLKVLTEFFLFTCYEVKYTYVHFLCKLLEDKKHVLFIFDVSRA